MNMSRWLFCSETW